MQRGHIIFVYCLFSLFFCLFFKITEKPIHVAFDRNVDVLTYTVLANGIKIDPIFEVGAPLQKGVSTHI